MDPSGSQEGIKELPKFAESTKNKDLYDKYFEQMPQIEQESEEIANEFDNELEWFNSEPLSFDTNLKNRLVLIDFWTS